ncbi:DNA alkylation repair protein [Streptobacillus felis]|uniref:DNA alkylation repair protein n=1 Tax=Streptobacillus felis TaxID=1384509 RepID=UPI000832E545|nr:DNA alkylation repair protein [Streptobacillus felis]
MDKIKSFLFSKQEEKYKEFTKKLNPTLDEDKIIGVRVPELRKYAKEIYKEDREYVEEYLEKLPHKYLEEYQIHMYLLDNEKDINILIDKTEKVLKYIDNWPICDIGMGKISKKYPEIVEKKIFDWLKSDHTFTVRFAIVVLITNFIKQNFKIEHIKRLSKIKRDEYYINIAIAWYFAECYSKHEEEVLICLENKEIENVWVHNKTIQKIRESLKVEKGKKEYLKTLKIGAIKK